MNLKSFSSLNMSAYRKIRNLLKPLKFILPYKKKAPNQETETQSTSNESLDQVSTKKKEE